MRKIISLIFFGVLAIGATIAQETGLKADNRSKVGNTNMFSKNKYFSKAGLGIINKSLYILVKSSGNGRNELIVKPTEETEEKWVGQSEAKAEIVVFYERKVWSTENLPHEFDLSKAVVVSFESDKVRFFDFQAMFGGYYERMKE